jgi:hypothetical protein
MSIYDDPVLAVRRQLEERGAQPSAVDEACAHVSQQVIAGEWLQIDGEAIHKVLGKLAQSVDEYCGALLVAKPHYLFELSPADDADKAFLGDGKTCTLRERGEFLTKYGPAVYAATLKQYGCNEGSLKAGTKPGATHDDTGKKLPPPKGSSTNPWDAKLFKGTETERMAKMASIFKRGLGPNSLAAELSKAAGRTITGAPLRR